ncbi:AAA family ATPase [Mycolicibacterium flavescens]|uniref:Cyclase n=1 Tax=Mycolicibacterium flavescens TaxID=1776 RepID=A0A1E3RK32_MYCFV|nr:adenylate/guanylate cyclase domain-containing protein [Mycolicibacterium flavescens]MCV7280619.1 AAA family ATPase [Mycolicibacterium flavescens]ODQ90219.1 cyclase [Mycolicibacterium flavescens]
MTSTAVTCGACGTGLRQDAKFCDACGTATVGATAEYKQVTVLFADVVRSMDIAATLDLERLREVMTALVERSVAVVQRFGGGTVEYTGDGVMAIFGAPKALEDHAFRACLAALAIQDEARQLAAEVQSRDGVALRLRVGLNSGRVIAGEIGSHKLGYAATGETVGFAQRMESAAPPGAVLVSESTARLVENAVTLAEPQWVSIKGSDEPVRAQLLTAIGVGDGLVGRADASLVGRHWEMAALDALVDRAIGGRGGVVNVVGPAGIGKSRVAREVAALAAVRGAEVFWTFCESHARDIPFHVVTRLLRAGSGVTDVDDDTARARLRTAVPADADPQDLLLLDDLLGVGDPDVPQPQIDPDARRRRLTALINSMTLARTTPALFIVEDAHWIDPVSESLVADLLAVIPRSPSLVLITSRPEYEGALVRSHHAQTIALSPLGDPETAALLAELLGDDPSIRELSEIIAERACGNPFFAEEMVRELVQRGELSGERGAHVCHSAAADVAVPATVQAAIEARIDRLSPSSRRTLSAASVIGVRFGTDLLAELEVDEAVDELLAAELIDQVRFTANCEYTFRHPLIRAVAYESQLKINRADLHRRVAAVIETRAPAAADENAALIAEHLEAAGESFTAYQWHMRAAVWATYRDIAAARQSWERARAIADAMPADDPNRTAMRIAPRTMLCGIAWRLHANIADDHIDQLRELCAVAHDDASLAIGAAGLVIDRAFQGRIRDASRLASQAWALIDSLGDATLTVGLSFPVIYPKGHGGEWCDVLQWSQRAIDLADGDPSKGNFLFGSPLALAFTTRAFARYCLGLPAWPDDLRRGLAMARRADPFSYATVVAYVYFPGIPLGVLAAHNPAVAEIEDALRIAERTGDDMALAFARVILALALAHRRTESERDRGRKLLTEISDVLERDRHNLSELRLINVYLARERARCGDRDQALVAMRAAVDELIREGQLLSWGIPATGVLVETLLDRGDDGDIAEAETALERLAAAPADGELAMRDIWLLKLRALLAEARGEDLRFAELARRYREMAHTLGFEGHTMWAEAMGARP